jgi:hypothetical protein
MEAASTLRRLAPKLQDAGEGYSLQQVCVFLVDSL